MANANQDKSFDVNSGTMLERLIFNNRAIILFICLVITLALGAKSFDLSLGASFQKMIPTNHPYIINYVSNKGQLTGVGNALRIAVEHKQGTIFNKEYLAVLQKITDEVFLLPGVDRSFMKSLWSPSVRWTGVTEYGLDGGPVISDRYDGSAESLEEVRFNVERSGEIGQLVSASYRSSVILIPLQETNLETGERVDYHELSIMLEDIRTRYNSDEIDLHITGFAKVVGDLIDGLQQVLVFFALTIGICTVVLYLYTRCLRSTLLVVFCSLVAVIWLLGLLPTLGYELDPYSILVPFLVFAIGLSHGAQKMNGIMQDIGRGMHKLTAARCTFRRLFLAGLTALISDAVGFAILIIIDIPVIQDLAITASIGVAVLIFTNLILLPIMLSYLGVNTDAATRSVKIEIMDEQDIEHKRHPIWVFLDLFTQRKFASIAIVTAIILAIFGTVIGSQVKIGDTSIGAPELRADSRYNLDNTYMVENYAASSDVFVVMVKTKQYACANYDNLLAVDALELKIQQLAGVEATNSLAGLAKMASAGMNEGSLKWYGVPRTQNMLNAIITRAPRELFNQNCDLLTIFVYLKDHKADTLTRVIETVEDFAQHYNSDDITFLNAAGNAGIEGATNIVVKQANTQMLMFVYAAVIILAFITFRSWQAVVCAVLPLMLTSILCQALMVWLDIGVKVATLPVIALGVGIGVDYALYILTITQAQLKAGKPLSEAYYKSLIFTGKVVILTGVTLGLAVSTWVFSPIKFQADMGILLAFMFIWNMLGALILLPALANFLLKPKVNV